MFIICVIAKNSVLLDKLMTISYFLALYAIVIPINFMI